MDMKNNGSGVTERKSVKGFTLVELIVVIAIIAILAGVINLATISYIRSARLETLNDRAQMVYMAFQDILLDCEINQDNTIFEPRGQAGDEKTDDILGAVIFFRISDKDQSGHPNVNGATGLGDEIHVMTTHRDTPNNAMAGNISSISVWADGSTNPGITSGSGANGYPDHGAYYWDKFNKYISGRLDQSDAGTYVVSVDLENYEVLSVICRNVTTDGRDPKTGLYSEWEVDDPDKALGKYINYYSDEGGHSLSAGGTTIKPPQRTFILKNKEHQMDISTKIGVDVGSYPYGDTLYDNVTKPSTLN
ncbi:MAG: prepilin-type N-terminal cleavage/methylation domain-containing protein [Oscillospiraceae bacterium]|nr:prepilin-type N-terminal cleavage/methylation domain-containing protein [Oscillospiraceae bacterium]